GTHDGLYRSSNGGATWEPSNRGLKSYNVLSLAIDPAAPATLYAATAIGVYKSTDAGLSWAELNSDLYVSALAIHPRSPSVLYAGTHLGVIKSLDSGSRWLRLRFAESAAEPPTGLGKPLPVRSRETALKPLPIRSRESALRPLPVIPCGIKASPPQSLRDE
ncbi:MAG TPA: hypothetical protein VGL03_09185, partial [Thermoanaerobaculia bacterium]